MKINIWFLEPILTGQDQEKLEAGPRSSRTALQGASTARGQPSFHEKLLRRFGNWLIDLGCRLQLGKLEQPCKTCLE